jgi:DNA polymerase-4/protein ImuB
VITRAAGSHRLVLDFSPELESLQPDMPLQPALARYGDAALLQADIPHYRSAFNGILAALEQVSPLVEGAEIGCAYVGGDGLHLIYPGEAALLQAMREAIPEAFLPQIGIAGNKFLAYLAARHSPPGGHRILTDGDIVPFLNDLPSDILPVSLKAKSRLHDFGINTLGQAAALPPGPLQSQFGPEGRSIRDLARGHDDTPLYPRMLEEAIEESITLASVTVSLEALLVALEMMLSRVFGKISPLEMGIRRLILRTRTWNAETWERIVQFKEPVMDIKSALARIKRVLEDYPQPGPVEQLGLSITRLDYPRGRQKNLFSDVRAREHLMNDIRQLEFRLGNPQVFTVKEVEPWSRIPERRYALTPTGQ